MTDEKFTFIEDLRDKKRTATGAHHKRSHCGKGGSVKFPSDFMTKKELKAMNGEVKEYRLDDPMSWEEFKAMPDDIKRIYIRALREKFDVPDVKIAEMLGVKQQTFQHRVKELGISRGNDGRPKSGAWDKSGWYDWVNSALKNEASEEPENDSEPPRMFVPCSGELTFEGKATDALATVELLLGEASVRMTVIWEGIRNED